MPKTTKNDRQIAYEVKRSDVAFIKIYLDDLNGVKVTTSLEKPQEKITAFTEKKADWILKNWQDTHTDLYEIDQHPFTGEKKIPYLGRSYRLILEKAEQQAFAFQKGKFVFHYLETWTDEEAAEQLRSLAKRWLYEKATEKFPALADVKVEAEEDYTRLGMKADDRIHMNWRLIQRPKDNIQQMIQDLMDEKTC